MLKLRTIQWGVLLVGMSVYAAGQDSSQQPTTPAPAFGQNAPILNPDNPPLSSLDEPSLDLKTASRSFISPAIQVGQSGDSNSNNQLNGSNLVSVSHVLGALDLQKFWPRSDLFLEYVGGGAFGNNPYYARQLEAAGLEGITRWRTGQFKVRDSFSYLPDGSFYATSAGGIPGLGLATGGVGLGMPGIFHLVFGAVGTIPRLGNTAVADVIQAINPRSAFTVIGAFSDSHFFHNTSGLLNGDETTGEIGYSHLVSRHDQIALVEAFQLFRFPDVAGGEIYNDIVNIRWSHTISGRLNFIGGIGPQYTDLRFGTSSPNWSVSGRAVLRYRIERASLLLGYEKFTSQGSGFFAGANTQIARLTYRRPLWRTYDLSVESSYSHNRRLQVAGSAVGNASGYDEGSAAVTLRKHLGRTWDIIGSYRFSDVNFNDVITFEGVTGKVAHRQIGTIAVEWHPKPTRIE